MWHVSKLVAVFLLNYYVLHNFHAQTIYIMIILIIIFFVFAGSCSKLIILRSSSFHNTPGPHLETNPPQSEEFEPRNSSSYLHESLRTDLSGSFMMFFFEGLRLDRTDSNFGHHQCKQMSIAIRMAEILLQCSYRVIQTCFVKDNGRWLMADPCTVLRSIDVYQYFSRKAQVISIKFALDVDCKVDT